MKTLYLKKASLLLTAIIICFLAQAQQHVPFGTEVGNRSGHVAIGDTSLFEAAALDIRTSNAGMLFPKVKLVNFDSLAPLRSGAISSADSLAMIGMIIYNVNPNIKGLNTGLVQWSGKEWKMVTENGGMAIVKCDVSTQNPAKLSGVYVKGTTLSPLTCTLTVPVNVSEPGAYFARAIVREGAGGNEAPFLFAGHGEFTQAGVNYIVLAGQGQPSKSTTDNGNVENTIELSINEIDQTACTMPTVFVSEKAAIYSFDCSSVKVISPRANVVPKLESLKDKAKIMLKITSSTPGAEYRIETDVINGVRFSGSGILTSGVNTVTLEGEGAPLKAGTYTYTIYGNNINETSVCTAQLNVEYDNIKVLLVSPDANNEWSLIDDRSAAKKMLQAEELFDFRENANAPFHIKSRSSITIDHKNQSGNLRYNDMKDYHLIIISYATWPDADMVRALCRIVKEGKTCLFTCDHDGTAGTGITGMNRIINILSDNNDNATPNHCATAGSNGDNRYLFLGGNLAVNGKYEPNLAGKYLGRDGGGNFLFTSLPDDWVVLASNSSNPRTAAKLIMHKRYRMFISGDGGIFTGGGPHWEPGADTYHASWVDTNGVPIPCTKRSSSEPTHNAHFLANLMIWAFEAAE